jgi:hypothetical protein
MLKLNLKNMSKNVENLTLNDLYKSESTRNIVYNVLSEEFEYIFEKLMREAKNVKSLLINPALKNKEIIKEKYIVYGQKLEKLEDIKYILDDNKVFDDVDEIDSKAPSADSWNE